MKLIIIGLLAAGLGLAQTYQVCLVKTDGARVTQSCLPLSAPVMAAMRDYVAGETASQVVDGGTKDAPRYKSVAHLVLDTVSDLIVRVVDKYPPPAMVKAKAARDTADASVETARKAALPVVPTTEP
jgi:hypothetical protein